MTSLSAGKYRLVKRIVICSPYFHRTTRPGSVNNQAVGRLSFSSFWVFAIFCSVGEEIVSGVRVTDRIGIGVLTRLVNRDLVDEMLAETGRVEQRSRSLPARVVVYYGLCRPL